MFQIFIIPKKADLYPPDRSPTDLGARIANRNLSCAQSLTCTHSDLGARKNRVLTWVCTQVTQVTTWEHPSLVPHLACLDPSALLSLTADCSRLLPYDRAKQQDGFVDP